MNIVTESYSYKQLSATANVSPVGGALGGIFCSSGTATVTIYNSATTTTSYKIVDTFTPLPGQFVPLPFGFSAGLYVVISGTGSFTVAYKQ